MLIVKVIDTVIYDIDKYVVFVLISASSSKDLELPTIELESQNYSFTP